LIEVQKPVRNRSMSETTRRSALISEAPPITRVPVVAERKTIEEELALLGGYGVETWTSSAGTQATLWL
jgi:hypothetical protein